MYCTKCGHEIPNGIECCPYCGNIIPSYARKKGAPPAGNTVEEPTPAVSPTVEQNQSMGETMGNASSAVYEQPMKQAEIADSAGNYMGNTPQPFSGTVSKKALVVANNAQSYVLYVKKKIVLILLAIIVVLIVFFNLLSFFNRPDLTNYIKINVSGIDGKGSATYSIDTEKVLHDFYGQTSYNDLSKDQTESYEKFTKALYNSVKTPDKVTQLSNGEVVIYHIDIAAVSKATGMSFKNNNVLQYNITDLQQVTPLSVNDLFDVSFEGVNGRGHVVLKVKDSSALPFNFRLSGRSLYLENVSNPIELEYNDDPATLSNNDTFQIGFSLYSDTDRDYINENYHLYIDSGARESLTVSGLTDQEELDIFSLVDISVSGAEGDARIGYHWKNKEYVQGNIKLTVEDETASTFSLYSSITSSGGVVVIKDDDNVADDSSEEYKPVANLRLKADKESGISDKDTITVTVSGGYEDVQNDTYLANGFTFKEIEHHISVDGSMLDRYITTNSQLNGNNIKAFAEASKESVNQSLLDNWSSYVHDSYRFQCYDQEIVSTVPNSTAYFACVNEYYNTYALWIVYICKVKDSELKSEKTLYILATANEPMINNATAEVKMNGSLELRKYDNLKAIEDYMKSYNTNNRKLYSYKLG